MKLLADMNIDNIVELVSSKKWPVFRAKQINDVIYQAKDYADANILPKNIREELQKEFIIKACNISECLISKDGTKKYLLKMYDGNIVESVFLKQNYGNTICLSTQIGCRMGCTFCASTVGGLIRNLSSGEMLSMIAVINADNGLPNERNFTNIVLMGSGEPLDNYDNVVEFLYRVNSNETFGIGMRNISLSTCGIVPAIYDLAKLDIDVTLCISLHAPNDEIRQRTMPIARKYSIDEITDAIRHYIKITKRRVILEYCLIDGVNDSFDHCQELYNRYKNMLVHFNIITINPYDNRYKKPIKSKAYAFVAELEKLGLSASLRSSKGNDIEGACGQLRAKRGV